MPKTKPQIGSIAEFMGEFCNLLDIVAARSYYQPHTTAYTFLQNGETESHTLTYGELERQSLAIAAKLQQLGVVGERALLLYPPGLEFISAFFGCLYAGVIAVPAYPPRRNQNLERLQAIVADSQAKIVLTAASLLDNLESRLDQYPELSSLELLATDSLKDNSGEGWRRMDFHRDNLAFLQYTSGSTGKPKGVMVSHSNLLYNQQAIQRGFGHTDKTIVVGWLPLFHDMGLIGNILQPLYLGIPCFLMAPVDFLQKPVRWLQAISRYGATTSGGPNFAYDLCVRKVTEEQKAGLDLSSWEVAFTGAEPVQAETLERFAEAFASCGFRREALYPCYGMAEATLFVSGGSKTEPPTLQSVEEKALADNRIVPAPAGQAGTRRLVGVGYGWLGQEIRIADPNSLKKCPTGRIGEIWLAGGSVTQGYWNDPQKTTENFQAYLADTGEGPFLRTGDLGFLGKDGELFVTGRLKDVIIIRGRNHYPQDIELTAQQSHEALILNHSAAFTVEIDGEEKLVIVAEVERRYRERRWSNQTEKELQEAERRNADRRQENPNPGFDIPLNKPPDFEQVVSNIRQAVAREHGLQVQAVWLLRFGSIPKTSSGKIRRYACRNGFLENTLNVVWRS